MPAGTRRPQTVPFFWYSAHAEPVRYARDTFDVQALRLLDDGAATQQLSRQRERQLVGVGAVGEANEVVGHHGVGELEPERRHLREHGALVRDPVRQHDVEGADAVRRDDEQAPVAEVIRVAHLAPVRAVGKGRVDEYRRSSHAAGPFRAIGGRRFFSPRGPEGCLLTPILPDGAGGVDNVFFVLAGCMGEARCPWRTSTCGEGLAIPARLQVKEQQRRRDHAVGQGEEVADVGEDDARDAWDGGEDDLVHDQGGQ
jgi:hypothetical protein